MKQEDQLRMISEIRVMMEQSSRFMSLSGLAGVLAGAAALAGTAAAWVYTNSSPFMPFEYEKAFTNNSLNPDFLRFFFINGLIVLSLALFTGFFFSKRQAERHGKEFWTRGARLMLINFSIPLITGAAFIVVMVHYQLIFLIPASCMIFYGLALVNGSKYTLHDIRVLGLFEIILGLAACVIPQYGILLWAMGFGILHIIYGLLIRRKYDTKKA